MNTRSICAISLLIIMLSSSIPTPALADVSGGLTWKMVWLWTMPEKSDAEIVSQAKSLGFNSITAHGPKMVEECHTQGLQAAGVVHFASAPREFAQVLSQQEEDDSRKNNWSASPDYQYGGEPRRTGEILAEDTLWCFDRPETLEFGKKEIDRVIALGCDTIAFDYIGYRNFHACFCPVSIANQKLYRETHTKLSEQNAINEYSRDRLVSFYEELIRYARSKKPGIVITAHIYPYFSPEPFYGNRIPLDYCGQTVSWFFNPHWSFAKITKYTHEVVARAAKYHPSSKGTPFIAVYTLPPYEKHRKTLERLREELRIVKRSGSTSIQMAELGHILNDPALARVVKEELNPDTTCR